MEKVEKKDFTKCASFVFNAVLMRNVKTTVAAISMNTIPNKIVKVKTKLKNILKFVSKYFCICEAKSQTCLRPGFFSSLDICFH